MGIVTAAAEQIREQADLPIARALQAAIHVLEESPGLRVRAHEVPLAVRENLVIASPHLALGRVCVDFERRHEPGRDRRKVCTRWGHIPQAFLLERSLSSMECADRQYTCTGYKRRLNILDPGHALVEEKRLGRGLGGRKSGARVTCTGFTTVSAMIPHLHG